MRRPARILSAATALALAPLADAAKAHADLEAGRTAGASLLIP